MVIEKNKGKTTPTKPVKSKKNLWWRPTVMDENIVSKLEEGFSRWLTDNEACLYADISRSTLFRYIEQNPEFWNRKELLKDMPKMKAKLVVTDKILEKDDYNSRWYLERKGKDEFSTKEIIDQTNKNLNLNKDVSELSDEELDRLINE